MDPQQAAMELTRLISGFQISRMIQVVASLGVADLLIVRDLFKQLREDGGRVALASSAKEAELAF
jgi:hypothetical protein